METNKKQNKGATAVEKQQKELTPQQLQARKKMVLFPLFFLAFAGCMWLIFAPDNDNTEPMTGFNTDLPMPEKNGIISDKRDAYIQADMKNKRQDKMRSLQDFAFEMDEEVSPEPRVGVSSGSSKPNDPSHALRSSAHAYADINRQLGSFYTGAEPKDARQSEMQARLDELEQRLEQEQERKTEQEEQVTLLEKSYEIAARYMNGGATLPEKGQTQETQPSTSKGKVAVQPVAQVRRNIVSLLAAPIPDSVFRAEFVKPRNWGFNTVGVPDSHSQKERNSIRAAVYRTVTIIDGGTVALRLMEPMMAGEVLIPANTVVTGTARIGGERLGITISAVQCGGMVIPVELLVYDLDGNEGISVPGSDEINAVKEIAANMGSGMGSSITITDDAGSQLLSDLGRSAIQGVSQYVSKKMRTVKVTLKADYQVLLLPPLK